MAIKYLHIFPILVFLWFPITFLVTFLIAVLMGHINPIFPYISDSGTFTPESCIFGQLINLGSILFIIVVYIRYRQTRYISAMNQLPPRVDRLNRVALVFGLVSAFGINLTANFQETNILIVHVFGGTCGFGLGVMYIVAQTYVSFKLFPFVSRKWILYARVIISVCSVVSYILCVVFGVLSFIAYKGTRNYIDMIKWRLKDGGREFHIISAISEWTTSLLSMLFILSLAPEFKDIIFSEPEVYVIERFILQSPTGAIP